jgi:hypothetical protein
MAERKAPPACSIALSSPREGAHALVDLDTFLPTLSVMADDFCQTALPPESPPGPPAALSRSAGVTLAMCGQWQRFDSERGFYRDAQRHLRAAFPSLPTREQCNRHVRQQHTTLVAFSRPLVRLLAAQRGAYEALEGSGAPPERRSAAEPDGCQDWLILAGATG